MVAGIDGKKVLCTFLLGGLLLFSTEIRSDEKDHNRVPRTEEDALAIANTWKEQDRKWAEQSKRPCQAWKIVIVRDPKEGEIVGLDLECAT